MSKVWMISLDGNNATQKQVRPLGEALAQSLGENTILENYRPQKPVNAVTLPNNTTVTWTAPLTPEQLGELSFNGDQFSGEWPDYIISCRPEVAAISLGIKQASGGKTKIIHIQNPNDATGTFQFSHDDFDLIIRQPQESLRAPNVLSSKMALHGYTPDLVSKFRAAADPKITTLKKPVMVVLVGGSDENITLDEKDYTNFGKNIRSANPDGTTFVVTARRTDKYAVPAMKSVFSNTNNIYIDDPRFNYDEHLSIADKFIVTGESLSMISESYATGRPVSAEMFNGKLDAHPLHVILNDWQEEGLISIYPNWLEGESKPIFQEAPDLARKILAFLNQGDTPSAASAFVPA